MASDRPAGAVENGPGWHVSALTADRSRLLFSVAALTLLLFGLVWRWPTLHQGDYLRFAAGRLAYSDIVALYRTRAFALHQLPYLQQPLEYPVLIGALIWLSSFAPGIGAYFLVNGAVLIACLVACFILLAQLDPPVPLLRFALAPALAAYAVLNWDALALVWLVAALYLVRRGRMGWSGAALAVGAAAKLFPVFAFPILLAQAFQQAPPSTSAMSNTNAGGAALLARVPRPAWRFILGFAAVTLLLNLPLALAAPRGWAYPYIFQATRDANIDSVWAGLPALPSLLTSFVFAAALVQGSLWLALTVSETGRWEEAVFLCLLLFCLFTKVYSPQYDLWLVPFLALLACPIEAWALFVVCDAAYYVTVFFYYAVQNGGTLFFFSGHSGGDALLLLRAAVWGRELALATLFVWALARFYGSSLTSWRRQVQQALPW